MQAMHMPTKATVVISADLTTSCRLHVPLNQLCLLLLTMLSESCTKMNICIRSTDSYRMVLNSDEGRLCSRCHQESIVFLLN